MIRWAAFIALAATPLGADTFTPPKGCEVYLTVQSRECNVAHHWTCEADPAGTRWSTEMGQNGLEYVGKIDSEAQWLDSYFAGTNSHETLILPAKDPASLTELLANGLDSYQFSIKTPTGNLDVTGFDRIVERDLVIDGEVLHRTEYSIRITDAKGALNYASEGSEYLSSKHRRFFSGYGRVTGPETPYDYNDAPVEFIYAGQSGFLDNTPKYGCDVLSARFDISERTLP